MKLPVPLTVLTGYLGSGKTTLLKALLRHPEMAGTAVVVNELGEVGLDDALIDAAPDETILLPSGCVCCAVRGDLVAALLRLHEDAMQGKVGPLKRVVLETTGLADPGPIAQALISDRDLFRIFRLDGIVTTVDAQHGLDELDRAFEAARQIALADRLVLTKTDLVGAARVEQLSARVRALNPAAPMSVAIKGAIAPTALFDLNAHEIREGADVDSWLAADRYPPHGPHCGEGCDHDLAHDGNGHLHGIFSFCLTFEAPLEARKLEFAIELLRIAHGPQLLRMKGLIDVAGHDRPFVIHGVQHVFYPVETLERWPSADRRSRLVFITRDLTEAQVRAVLAPLIDARPVQ